MAPVDIVVKTAAPVLPPVEGATITFDKKELTAFRELLSMVRGDIRKRIEGPGRKVAKAIDAALGPEVKAKTGKRWKIVPHARENGRGYNYVQIVARRGNTQ